MSTSTFTCPEFLKDLLDARSPSGYEFEAQKVYDRHMENAADRYDRDALGNRFAWLRPDADPIVLFAGHIDELGLQVTYINKEGYLYFDTIGGHDKVMIPGRRVILETQHGKIAGVTGKRAVHLMNEEDRKKVPQIHEMWIDIGVSSREEAQKLVQIGDVATYDMGFQHLRGSLATARAMDDKVGAYICGEALRRLAADRQDLKAGVVAVATTQEEIGTRGAMVAAYSANPHLSITVDVSHATDHPDTDPRKHGDLRLGGGPALCRGANINPFILERLIQCAEKENIPYQMEADPRPTGTDARAIQMARGGIATGLVCIPLRYMHTPCEIVDLQDVENAIRLLVAFTRSLQPGEHGIW